MMKKILTIFSLASVLPLTAQVPPAWLPMKGQLLLTPAVNFDSYNSAWQAENLRNTSPLGLSYNTIKTTTYSMTLEYGLDDKLALDGTFGFAKMNTGALWEGHAGGEEARSGFIDKNYGLRYKLLNEFDFSGNLFPTIAVRFGIIIAGDYNDFPQAIGDGAGGVRTSLLFGKNFDFFGLGYYGELSYRVRGVPVPDDILITGGIFHNFRNLLFTRIGYNGQIGLSGYDITPPGQKPSSRKEHFHRIEGGAGYIDSYGRFYNFFVGSTVAGFNTARNTNYGFSVVIPLLL